MARPVKWDRQTVTEMVRDFKYSKADLCRVNPAAYNAARRGGWLENLPFRTDTLRRVVRGHMAEFEGVTERYWPEIEAVLMHECLTTQDFRTRYAKLYARVSRYGWNARMKQVLATRKPYAPPLEDDRVDVATEQGIRQTLLKVGSVTELASACPRTYAAIQTRGLQGLLAGLRKRSGEAPDPKTPAIIIAAIPAVEGFELPLPEYAPWLGYAFAQALDAAVTDPQLGAAGMSYRRNYSRDPSSGANVDPVRRCAVRERVTPPFNYGGRPSSVDGMTRSRYLIWRGPLCERAQALSNMQTFVPWSLTLSQHVNEERPQTETPKPFMVSAKQLSVVVDTTIDDPFMADAIMADIEFFSPRSPEGTATMMFAKAARSGIVHEGAAQILGSQNAQVSGPRFARVEWHIAQNQGVAAVRTPDSVEQAQQWVKERMHAENFCAPLVRVCSDFEVYFLAGMLNTLRDVTARHPKVLVARWRDAFLACQREVRVQMCKALQMVPPEQQPGGLQRVFADDGELAFARYTGVPYEDRSEEVWNWFRRVETTDARWLWDSFPEHNHLRQEAANSSVQDRPAMPDSVGYTTHSANAPAPADHPHII